MPGTANPDWFNATNPLDLIPDTDDPHGMGERFLRLVSNFKLTQGTAAGLTFGAVALPWQQKLIRKVWGDTNADGEPMIRNVGVKIGKGSGKTSMAAAIACACVIDWHARRINTRAAVIIVSAGIEAANICFQHLREGIAADRHLVNKFKSNLSRRELTHIASGVVIRVIPPALEAAVGLRPGLVIGDEIHQASIVSKEFESVIDQLVRGGQNQEEFRYIAWTTAAVARPVGYYAKWLRRLRAIRDGELVDPATLPVLYEWPSQKLRPDLDIGDAHEWWRGMPSLRTKDNPKGTMDASALAAELREAADDADINGQATMELLLSQRLGMEAHDRDGGTGSTPLAQHWAACHDPDMRVRTGAPLFVGIDPSPGIDDPAAVVTVILDNDHYYAWSKQFLLRGAFDSAPRKLKEVYEQALEAGELELLESTTALELAIHGYCKSLRGNVSYSGDSRGLAGFARRFEERVGPYKSVAQDWTLRAALDYAGALAYDRRLHHGDQPLLSFNVGNVILDNGRIRKYDSSSAGVGSGKIDGCSAMLSAIQAAEAEPVWDVSAVIG